jgi:starch synthase
VPFALTVVFCSALQAQSLAPEPIDAAATASPGSISVAAADQPLTIWMAASEAVPYVKTGGLADVVTSLSEELARQGHRPAVFLPLYKSVRVDGALPIGSFRVPGDGGEPVKLLRARRGGVDVYFLAHDGHFGVAEPYAYGYGQGGTDRFVFYSRAVHEAARFLGVKPEVLHAHDWQASLSVPLNERSGGFSATMLTLHNLAYQGGLSRKEVSELELDWLEPRLRIGEGWGLLRGGIESADKITTVSRTYAAEIQDPRFGLGLSEALRRRSADLEGIINGIDTDSWNPRTDPALRARFGPLSASAGKTLNKLALQRDAGLEVDGHAPLFGFAARLVEQKGIDFISSILPKIVDKGGQVAIAGAGPTQAEALKDWARRFPKRVFAPLVFDETLARRIFSASDFLLMPSRFEPCGLSQLIAMRYGAIPIVTPTGGLIDTVVDGRTGLFMSEASAKALLDAVVRALELFRRAEKLYEMRAAAMSGDWSWGPAAQAYLKLYREALQRKG